jgi:HemY protein
MKRVLLIGIVLLIAALIADWLMPDPGYAALHFGARAIQFPLPLFIAVLIGVFTITYVVVRLVRSRTPGTREQQLRKSHEAHSHFVEGMMQLSAGEWSTAEQTLSRSARGSESAFAHYLGAARASELLGDWERRDQWIDEALRQAPAGQRAAVLITQAEFALKHNQPDIALQALETLQSHDSHNARSLGLLARIYRVRGDSGKLQALAPRLRSVRGVPVSLINETTAQIFLDRINAAAQAGDRVQLKAVCD